MLENFRLIMLSVPDKQRWGCESSNAEIISNLCLTIMLSIGSEAGSRSCK